MRHYVVIGAGPVGLALSVHILLLSDENRITIYEKREDPFKRAHLVRWSPQELPFWKNPRARKLRKSLTKVMPLQKIQEELATLARELGAEWIKSEILAKGDEESLAGIIVRADTQRVFVTTGSKGKLANNLFEKREIIEKRTFVVCTAKLNRSVRSLRPLTRLEMHRTQREMPGIITEIVFEDMAMLSIDLGEKGGGINAKLNTNSITALEGCRTWAGARGDVVDARVREYTSTRFRRGKFSKIEFLEISDFGQCGIECSVEVFLIGDAALGFPFETSLHYGLKQTSFALLDIDEFEREMNNLANSSTKNANKISRDFRKKMASLFYSIAPSSILNWKSEDTRRWRETPLAGLEPSPEIIPINDIKESMNPYQRYDFEDIEEQPANVRLRDFDSVTDLEASLPPSLRQFGFPEY